VGRLRCGKILSAWVTVAAVGIGAAVAGTGVHNGGVGSCSTCHTMHAGAGQNGGSLLLSGSSSDLCLSCHATEYGAVLGPDALAPPPERGPGNFVFLLSTNINDGADGATNPIPGDAAGHNLSAPGHGLATDGTRLTSPGGTYPAADLKCTSCHDPHGNTNYRFLWGPGGNSSFAYAAPEAEGLDLALGEVENNANHVAYRGGVSLWCANCHAGYLQKHNRMGSSFRHWTDTTMGSMVRERYGVYNGTADPTGGVAATSYLAAVPFEVADNTLTRTSGPTATSRVMCLTCHRAHATSSPAAGRWDFNVARLGDDGLISGSYPLPNPYLDPDQDPLCRKCHSGGGHPMNMAPISD